jgi:hypothetical protein|tara:strand:+ start:260 stop:1663 length:1404 start_codon:yes stop_codon:yes gene_type:complete
MSWYIRTILAELEPVPPAVPVEQPQQSEVIETPQPSQQPQQPQAPQLQLVPSVITQNKAGRRFLTLYGMGTFSIKEQLGKRGLGFRFFQGRWSKAVDFIDAEQRTALEALGVDTSPLDQTEETEEAVQPQEENKPAGEMTPVEQQLVRMKSGVEQAMQAGGASDKVKALLQFVDDKIDELGAMVDEAAASDFIKHFLSFSARFWKYSFGNQILIWIQKPDATQVAGGKQWFDKFGRQVTDWDADISIIAPRTGISKEGKEIKKKVSSDQWNRLKSKYEYTYFTGATVYDIGDTEPVAGWKGPKGEDPFEPANPRTESNESVEEITAMIEAARAWGKSKNIDIQSEGLREGHGGYSSGGKIRINNAYQGMNLFSTLIHELAHEVLHQNAEAKGDEKKPKEIDAESTAYIVLKRYGWESKDAPNYLALWRSTGENVKERRNHIVRAVKEIIEGIDGSMQSMGVEQEREE